MNTELFEEEVYKGENYTNTPLAKGSYEYCTFIECNFLNADLSHITFVECSFQQCDLTNANLNQTAFKEVSFKHCKLMGLRFDYCNPFLMAVRFEHCNLKLSSFYGLALKNTVFETCNLQEADFTESDFTGANFANSDLGLATFDRTTLEKADFRTAYNYAIDPELNRIKKAKFSADSLAGLLGKFDIVVE